jgi:S-formylglutathione hydrolase FrmB
MQEYTLASHHQSGPTRVRIVAPPGGWAAARVIYLLPVEAGDENVYGDGLAEAARLGLTERLDAVLVAPTFSQLPWYADHPADPAIGQERYLLEDVAPLVRALHPAPAGLLGFSKSGWGAFSLLLRHPDVFVAACAWDAPLMQARPDCWGMAGVFGGQANFEQHHVSRLIEDNAAWLRLRQRLGVHGYGNFREHTRQAHALLESLGIPHAYRDGPWLAHRWDSGWLEPAAQELAAML